MYSDRKLINYIIDFVKFEIVNGWCGYYLFALKRGLKLLVVFVTMMFRFPLFDARMSFIFFVRHAIDNALLETVRIVEPVTSYHHYLPTEAKLILKLK